MPELPEVETIRRGLNNYLPDKIIAGLEYDWAKGFPNTTADVEQFVIGARIVRIWRRAKMLIIDLSTNYSLIIHLKMTGQLVYRASKKEHFGGGHPSKSLVDKLPDRSTRVVMCLERTSQNSDSQKNTQPSRDATGGIRQSLAVSRDVDDKKDRNQWRHFGKNLSARECAAYLFFNDQRKFGWMRLLPTNEASDQYFFHALGPEPLAANFSDVAFCQQVRRHPRASIKAVLLNQSVVAGVGNIYADEALWGAKIHPSTKVSMLTTGQLNTLFIKLRHVLSLGISKGGSTDRNYVDATGKEGKYLTFAKVFRRQGQPCYRCGTIIQKSRVAGRGTHFCPRCQVEPR